MNELEQFRTDARKLNIMLIVQDLLASLVVSIVGAMLLGMKMNKDLAFILSSIIATSIVTYYILRRYQKKFDLSISYKPNANFNISLYLKYTIMALGAAWLVSMLMDDLMDILSGIIIFETPDFSMKYNFTTNIFLIIETVIVAPIAEELLFRGVLLGKLKQYGKVFAIIVVSLIFGLMHGNLPQTIPAFVSSIFLSWVTLSSDSILPAISIHMINNAVAHLEGINNDMLQILVNIIIIGVIIGAVILIIKEYRSRGKYKLECRVGDYFKNWAGRLILIFTILLILGSIIIV